MPPVTALPVPPLSAEEEALVRALGRVMSVLPKLIDADMRADAGISLTEYTILMHLSEAPDRQMRMSELATMCDLSVSGMTRAVARLESEKLVQRSRCEEDGRGWLAGLTDAGLNRLVAAYPTNLVSTRRRILDHFAGVDPCAVARALEGVANS
jgi:DNA-binding MarR family transcriptional regulator